MTRITVPEKAHPLVREFYRLVIAKGAHLLDVHVAAGLGRNVLAKWRTTNTPNVASLEAALNVIGYRLAIVPLDDSAARDNWIPIGAALKQALADSEAAARFAQL